MDRSEKLSASVTPDEKKAWRKLAAEKEMTLSELLWHAACDTLEAEGYDTSRENDT